LSHTGSSPNFYRATESLRNKLKLPLGELVPDVLVSARLLQERVFSLRSEVSLIASIGDRTTARLHGLGLYPDLEIIDNIEKRHVRSYPLDWNGQENRILRTVNPPGGIDSRAVDAIEKSFDLLRLDSKNRVRLLVEGEEDMLVLPLVSLYPGSSITMYGQPGLGLVVVDSLKSKILCSEYLAELGMQLS